MGRLFVCALLFSFVSTDMWASTTDDLTPAELLPAKTSFAYRTRHSWSPLPGPALSAMWFSGEDRELPQMAVAEPIVVLPAQSTRHQPSRNALCSHAAVVAAEHDLPVPFFANLIQQESGFKSHVVSPAGAQGIAQFMPRVARAYGLENPFDPLHSLSVSAKFLRELLVQFGNIGLAAAAYNAGPRRVQDWMARRGKLPDETKTYVRNITGHPAERWARVNARTEETLLPQHARCPGIPAIEVSVPEAAPVRVAKNGAKGKRTKLASKPGSAKATEAKLPEIKVAGASEELPKLAAAKAAGPKLAAAKSFTLSSAEPGKKIAVIKNGKIQILAAKSAPAGKKPAAAAKTVVAVKEAKPAAKTATKTAAKGPTKTPAKSATKVAAKPAAKPAKSKQATGKRMKLAAVR
jgi:transglycosylase-like protein with SLT domain